MSESNDSPLREGPITPPSPPLPRGGWGGDRPAVFLDRDGTIIEDAHHLSHVDQVRLIPGAGEAVRRLNEHGLPVVVVTNQSGVARGFFPESLVADVYARLRELLAEQGAHVDGHYHCPHHPTEGSGRYTRDCECRKPKPGMLLAAARELSLDLSRSWMVGDRLTDPQAGAAAGAGQSWSGRGTAVAKKFRRI